MTKNAKPKLTLVPMCYEFHSRNDPIATVPTSEMLGYVEREGLGETEWVLYYCGAEYEGESGTAYKTPELALIALLQTRKLPAQSQVRKPVPARYSVEEGSKPIGWLESYGRTGWEWTLYENDSGSDDLCISAKDALKRLTRRLSNLRQLKPQGTSK